MSATSITRLPPVIRGPANNQYIDYQLNRVRAKAKPYFKPRFTFSKEKRQHTFGLTMISKTDPLMPPYPYGKNNTLLEANFGLYGGTTLQSGNKISKGRNKGKTLRKWFPNVKIEKIRSEVLDVELKIPITHRVMRTIRKCGGLDEYVLGTKPARIKELGLLGWKLRWLIMTSPKMLAKYDKQRRELGLPESTSLRASFEDAWNDEEQRMKYVAQQESAWEDLRQAATKFEEHVRRNWIDSGEKEAYDIPKLETLQKVSPATMLLPQHLEHSQSPKSREPVFSS